MSDAVKPSGPGRWLRDATDDEPDYDIIVRTTGWAGWVGRKAGGGTRVPGGNWHPAASGEGERCFLLEDDPPAQHGKPIACTQCWNALSELHEAAEARVKELEAERDQLRAECNAERNRAERLRAEVKRLSEENEALGINEDLLLKAERERDELRAENERLREALRRARAARDQQPDEPTYNWYYKDGCFPIVLSGQDAVEQKQKDQQPAETPKERT